MIRRLFQTRGFFYGILFLLALAFSLPMAGVRSMPVPEFDSVEYLAYARSLYLAGTYATTPAGSQADTRPGREPLYPVVIAAAAHVFPQLGQSLASCSPPAADCRNGFRVLPVLNALLLAGTAVLAAASTRLLGGGRIATIFAWGYVAFNFQMFKDMKYAISDYLAIFLLGLVVLSIITSIRNKFSALSVCFISLSLSLLAFDKYTFLPFAFLAVLALGIGGIALLRQSGPRALLPALLAGLVLTGLNGSWLVHNLKTFGVPTDGRGAIALSTREIFDHMTPSEHLAAYLWWTRGPGAGLARKWLPEEAWLRHDWYTETGFYIQGQVTRPAERVRQLMREENLSEVKAESRASRLVAAEIAERWPAYLATMPALFYRGLWFDEFIVLGLPALGYLLVFAVRKRRWPLVAALSPGLWSLCVYPAVSLNIPRYQMVSVTALAVASGLTLEMLYQSYRERRIRRGTGRE